MSLYYVQKFVYDLNRSPETRKQYESGAEAFFAQYDLTQEEKQALANADIGLLYVMGVNGQLLMHYAAYRGYAWDDYIQAMKDGLHQYGGVRDGLYAAVDEGCGGAV